MHTCIYNISITTRLEEKTNKFGILVIFLLVKSENEVTQLCPTLCDPMDGSLPGSVVRGIFQARILEWAAISFSRESSQPRDRTWVSCTADRHFTVWATREGPTTIEGCEANVALTGNELLWSVQDCDCVNSAHEDYFRVLDLCFHFPTHLSRNLFLQVSSLR